MRTSALEIEPGTVLETDVCIVGGGPMGLTIAWELVSRGIDVIVLERGDEGSLRYPAGEALRLGPNVFPVRTPTSGGVVGPYPLQHSRGMGLGGSSGKWAWKTPNGTDYAQFPAMDDADFEDDPGGLPGWPISFREVAAHFRRAEEICGLGPVDLGMAGDSSPAPEGVRVKLYRSCASRTFHTEMSGNVSRSRFARVLLGGYATTLIPTADGLSVAEVHVATRPDRVFRVRGRDIVLATGGLENARLLLHSRSRAGSLLFGGEMVGRGFMEHLNHDAGYLVPANPRLLRDPTSYAQWEVGGSLFQRKYQLVDALRREWQLPNVAYELNPLRLAPAEVVHWHGRDPEPGRRALQELRHPERRRSSIPRLLADIASDAPGLLRGTIVRGLGRLSRSQTSPPRVFRVAGCAEQFPDPARRVELEPETDAYGVPITKLYWEASRADLERIERSRAAFGAALQTSGTARLIARRPPAGSAPPIGVGFHHMGATRMAESPNHGSVDRNSMVHGMKNLYVAGTSVFATGGSANPTFTAIALSIRLALHLSNQRKPGLSAHTSAPSASSPREGAC